MLLKFTLIASWICSLQGSVMKWSIDWTSDSNFLSGTYLSRELVQRIIKLDSILQQKIGALDDEIQTNFKILMAIISLMSVIMVMAMHTCYLACKKRVDTAIIAKQDVSRMPVIQDQHLLAIREQNIVDLRGQMIRPPILRENPKPATAPIQKNNDKDNYIEMKTPVNENWVNCQHN